METWSPLTLYLLSMLFGGISGIGGLCLSSKEITLRGLISAAIFYGMAGSGLGMLGVYDYLDGKARPWRVLAASSLVGIGTIKMDDIREIVLRMLSPTKTKEE